MPTDPDIAALAGKLTKAQREAIYPGPGNPEYARAYVSTIVVLYREGIVASVPHWSRGGKSTALLTWLGHRVRAHLIERQEP